MTNLKNILLIGSSGRGKSTLANVLTNTNNFKESNSSTSETRNIQAEKFDNNNTNCQVIDTPGIGDTKLTQEQVLDIIAEAVYLARQGISQVLFVTNGRFDQFEMATYNILREVIFDHEVTQHTTIIRTHFPDFRKPSKCQEDISLMINQADEKNKRLEKELKTTNLAEIITSCQQRFIHVDNPSLALIGNREKEIEIRIRKRNKSKAILLTHLSQNCQESLYQPEKLKSLSDEVVDYMTDKLQKRLELKEKEAELGLEEDETNLEVEAIAENQTNEIIAINEVYSENEKIVAERGKKNTLKPVVQPVIDPKELLRSGITNLRDELERIEEKCEESRKKLDELEEVKQLKEEIQKLDENIRQKVRDHILNNRANISKLAGGDIFLKIIKNDNNFTKKNISDLTSERKECEHKLAQKKNNNRSLDKIEKLINQTEQAID
jgi:predicted GTPase